MSLAAQAARNTPHRVVLTSTSSTTLNQRFTELYKNRAAAGSVKKAAADKALAGKKEAREDKVNAKRKGVDNPAKAAGAQAPKEKKAAPAAAAAKKEKKEPTAADLDAELEAHMGKTKAGLDAQLDEYMAKRPAKDAEPAAAAATADDDVEAVLADA